MAEAKKVQHIRDAVKMMQHLNFPLCVVPFPTFKKMGRFIKHEEARNNGDLIMLDTWTEAVEFGQKHSIVFNSHQWLAWREPDLRISHPAMVAGVSS